MAAIASCRRSAMRLQRPAGRLSRSCHRRQQPPTGCRRLLPALVLLVLLSSATVLDAREKRRRAEKPSGGPQGGTSEGRAHFAKSCPISFAACDADEKCSAQLDRVLSQPGWRPPPRWADDEPETFVLLVDCVAGRLEDTAVADMAQAVCPTPAPPPRGPRPVLGGVDVVAYFDKALDWRDRSRGGKQSVVAPVSGAFSFNLTTHDYTNKTHPIALGPWKFWFSTAVRRFDAYVWTHFGRFLMAHCRSTFGAGKPASV